MPKKVDCTTSLGNLLHCLTSSWFFIFLNPIWTSLVSVYAWDLILTPWRAWLHLANLPVGWLAAVRYPQNCLFSRLKKPWSLNLPLQSKCSSPSLCGGPLLNSFQFIHVLCWGAPNWRQIRPRECCVKEDDAFPSSVALQIQPRACDWPTLSCPTRPPGLLPSWSPPVWAAARELPSLGPCLAFPLAEFHEVLVRSFLQPT